MDRLLNVLIITSATRSNPDISAISSMLESLKLVNGLLDANVFLLCDGYKRISRLENSRKVNFKKALIGDEDAIAYEQYLDNLERFCRMDQKLSRIVLHRSGRNRGFVGLIKYALMKESDELKDEEADLQMTVFRDQESWRKCWVDTPYTMVLQHDWIFRRKCDLFHLMRAFDEPRLNFLTFSSLSTQTYPDQLLMHYKYSKIMDLNGVLCWPLDFFYDRNHIVRTSFYTDRVFLESSRSQTVPKHLRVKRFIEDSLGQFIRLEARDIGIERCFEKWGLAIYVEDDEFEAHTNGNWEEFKNAQKPLLYHIDGRRFQTQATKDQLKCLGLKTRRSRIQEYRNQSKDAKQTDP